MTDTFGLVLLRNVACLFSMTDMTDWKGYPAAVSLLAVCAACTGLLPCPACSRLAVDYHTLAQHMKDKHAHEPSKRSAMSVSLSDLLEASRYSA